MNCLTFKEDFESRHELEGEMLEHFESCRSCGSFVKEERALDGMFARLPKSTAPNDFGTSVRSRIRKGRGPVSGLWAGARILIPAAAMVLIIGFVVMNSDLFVSTQPDKDGMAVKLGPEKGVESIKGSPEPETDTATDVEEKSTGSPDSGAAPVPKKKDEKKPATRRESELAGIDPAREAREPAKGGGTLDSKDEAFEEAESTNPPGLDPNRKVKSTPPLPSKEFSTREILETLGVESVWRDGQLFVISVVRKSAAWRAGVKAGDQIHSLDGIPVRKGVGIRGRVKGEHIHVIRDGKRIILRIGAKK